MLSLLMQVVVRFLYTSQAFTIKDKFVPAQKNETQLQFKKTCADPRRKAKILTMRYA